ncbi:hypothetical protein HF521_006231 [Silurus meridionalis]|uniref:Uncharacterized protein n=1 Tax=Silurus meridionalis TaxID=175797 RepID=A0A8T0ASP8_SILME|nr:hypothetical protein HF521_006231 [Silurus meridionalis]
MFNKFCEWIESGIATLRNEVPAAQDPSDGVRSDRRKRPLEGLEDGMPLTMKRTELSRSLEWEILWIL